MSFLQCVYQGQGIQVSWEAFVINICDFTGAGSSWKLLVLHTWNKHSTPSGTWRTISIPNVSEGWLWRETSRKNKTSSLRKINLCMYRLCCHFSLLPFLPFFTPVRVCTYSDGSFFHHPGSHLPLSCLLLSSPGTVPWVPVCPPGLVPSDLCLPCLCWAPPPLHPVFPVPKAAATALVSAHTSVHRLLLIFVLQFQLTMSLDSFIYSWFLLLPALCISFLSLPNLAKPTN